jgi:hypothetical protein
MLAADEINAHLDKTFSEAEHSGPVSFESDISNVKKFQNQNCFN